MNLETHRSGPSRCLTRDRSPARLKLSGCRCALTSVLKVNSDEVDKGALTKGRLHSWLETTRKALRGPKRRSPLEVRTAAQNIKINKYANLARNNNHEFVPLVAESLGGLGGMAVKLFGEIARAQASTRPPVGHILRRLIDIRQIAVQKGNF